MKAVSPTRYGLGFLFRGRKLSIGTRLTACFVAIVLLMIAADVVAIWQFWQMAVPMQRLSNADKASLAVIRVHLDIDMFRDQLTALASNRDTRQFASEAASLGQKFQADVEQAEQTLSASPDIEQDATISSALQTLKITLPTQFDTAVELATAGDWTAVRLRLTEQIQDLIDLTEIFALTAVDWCNQAK